MQYEKISGFSDEISSEISIQFTVLKKLGIGYFEPRGINGKNISILNDREVNHLKSEMDKYGIKASSIGSPIGKIKITDNFDEHFEMYKRVVDTAKKLDCKYIRIFSFYNDGDEWTDQKRTEVFRRMRILVEYAKQENVVLLHENEKDIYGDNIERCAEIMEEFFCENFGAVFDPANFVQTGVDTISAFNKLQKYVKYMHIKDALNSDNRVVPAGMGDGNVEYILNKLFDDKYNGFISLEPHLGSFEGLGDLEIGDEMLSLPKSGEGTFTIAYNALCSILKNIKEI